ncbi:hypothetical protein N7467_010930 [Penicillium canescens]|nr:hypothetical protein N7467_010930 [Penicillium canescens]
MTIANATVSRLSWCISMLWDAVSFLLSFKTLPFAWHLRGYDAFFRCYMLDSRPVPPTTPGCLTIFQPTVWTTGTPLGEIDILGHKSNSTYFTDCDAARCYHIFSLCCNGFRRRGLYFFNPGSRAANGNSKPIYFAVASVNCTFRKPIQPGQKYDICTRILSWDEKWIYVISHFVEKGTLSHARCRDQPDRQQSKLSEDCQESGSSAVLASSIARAVLKQGRATIRPDEFFRDCKLLPREDDDGQFCGETPDCGNSQDDPEVKRHDRTILLEAIESRRYQGLKIADNLNRLDEGVALFNAREQVVYAKL